jgi:hypothetical protein
MNAQAVHDNSLFGFLAKDRISDRKWGIFPETGLFRYTERWLCGGFYGLFV